MSLIIRYVILSQCEFVIMPLVLNRSYLKTQVVNMEFENGTTVAFSLVATTEALDVRKVSKYFLLLLLLVVDTITLRVMLCYLCVYLFIYLFVFTKIWNFFYITEPEKSFLV